MLNRETFRITPKIPAEKMTSFEIAAPLSTHWRRASCAEVICPDYHNGWTTPVEALLPGERTRLKAMGFLFVEVPGSDGPVLMFEQGQRCMGASRHRVRADREEIFLQRAGDWRVPLGQSHYIAPVRTFSGADAFADALHTQLDKFAD